MEREMDRGKVQVHILYFTRTGSALAAKLAQELAREANVTYASGKGCCKAVKASWEAFNKSDSALGFVLKVAI